VEVDGLAGRHLHRARDREIGAVRVTNNVGAMCGPGRGEQTNSDERILLHGISWEGEA
jgi:hypothetical protein